jgi:hypothetical protein
MKREGNIPSEPPLGRKPRTSRMSRTSATGSIAPGDDSEAQAALWRPVGRPRKSRTSSTTLIAAGNASVREVLETQFLDEDGKAVKKGKDLKKSQKGTLACGQLSPRTRSQISSMKRRTRSQARSQAGSIRARSRASPQKRVRQSSCASNGNKSQVGEPSKVSKSMSPSVVIEKLDMSKVGKETKKEKAAEEVKARARLSDIIEEPDHEQSSLRFSFNSIDQDLFAESGSDAFNDLESESSDGSSQPAKK